MAPERTALARLRPFAAPWLLVVFLFGAQLSPMFHLATHRDDHTHGPELPADHDDDHDHDDDDHDHGGRVLDHHHDDALLDEHHDDHGDVDDHDHDDHDAATLPAGLHGDHASGSGHHRPAHDHGRQSSSHFGLALLAGPPPPFLPPPFETQALPPDTVQRGHHAAALPHPPARGPPSLD